MRGMSPGALLSLDQAWQLGRTWYADRMAPTWRRKTIDEVERLFGALGLRGSFWRFRE